VYLRLRDAILTIEEVDFNHTYLSQCMQPNLSSSVVDNDMDFEDKLACYSKCTGENRNWRNLGRSLNNHPC
jgi:hypothetical protein